MSIDVMVDKNARLAKVEFAIDERQDKSEKINHYIEGLKNSMEF